MDDFPDVMNDPKYCEVFALQKICFDLIVQKFDRFYFAFTVLKTDNARQNFEFLQSTYSAELAIELYEKKKMKEKYFDLLINEHLNFLNGEWLKKSRVLNSIEDIFRHLSNLTRICFRNCDDEILKNVANFCPKIIEIDVSDSKVTDIGVKYLYELKKGTVACPKIKNLLIENSCVTDRGVECLIRHLPSLERIVYRNVPLLLHAMHEENLYDVQKIHCYNLVEIDLLRFQDLPYYTEVLNSCLIACPKLESIACSITDQEQLNFFHNCHLKELYLSVSDPDTKINIDKVIKMNGCNLRVLNIKHYTISASFLSEHCPVLKELYIEDVNFIIDNNHEQIMFPCLIKLFFSQLRPSDAKAFCLLLSKSPKLESVSFISCKLSLEMKNQILMWCKNSSARKIEFQFLQLEMKFIRDILLSCSSLKEMGLNCCLFDDDDHTKRMAYILAKSLPNKPFIIFQRNERSMMDYCESYFDYLKMYSVKKYISSSNYDSLFHAIALKWRFGMTK